MAEEDPTIPRSTLLKGYAACLAVLLLVQATSLPGNSLVRFQMPSLHFEDAAIGLLFSTLLATGLCISLLRRRLASWVTVIVASYAFSGLAVSVVGGWVDFVNRDGRYRTFEPLLSDVLRRFFTAHSPTDPFGIGFWTLLTPLAFAAMIGIAIAVWFGGLDQARLASRTSTGLFLTACACAGFGLGSQMAEVRFPFGEVMASDLTFPIVPIVLLGSLTAWVAEKVLRPAQTVRTATAENTGIDLDKVISSASQISVALLVILGLGISQTASYAEALSELIAARKAFALDLVHDRIVEAEPSWATSTTKDGIVTKSAFVHDVPWASVDISFSSAEPSRYTVEIREGLSGERWAVPVTVGGSTSSTHTQQVADRHGVKYDKTESAEKIFPRIDAQLRARAVAFPDVGLSLELKTFALFAPLVTAAMLVVLAYRVASVASNYSVIKEPWILIEANQGGAGTLARAWIACIAGGPWVLTVLLVEVLALTHKARGFAQGSIADVLATLYVAFTLILVVLSTKTCVRSLLTLRTHALRDKGAATSDNS